MVTEIYIARNTEPLVFSSFLFLIPAIYAYYVNLYFYTILSVLTFCISVNYWRKATIGFRRNLDLIFSKISFSIYVTTQLFYLYYDSPLLLGYPIFKNSNISKKRFIISYIYL